MQIPNVLLSQLIIAAAAAALFGWLLAGGAWFAARRVRRQNQLIMAQIDAVQEQAKSTAAAVAVTDRDLRRLKRRCRILTERLAAVELLSAGRTYDQAIDWVRRGAKPEALAKNLGISRGEAELVTALHAQKKSA